MRAGENINRVCVILGAGASYDVRTPGSRVIQEDCRPPLASSLFDALNSWTWQVLQHYSGARFLRARLEMDNAQALGMEDALRRYAFHESEPIRQQFKHVPPFLRDLVYQCSQSYINDPDGYIQLVTELLAENFCEVLFLTLNYDNLLEKSLTALDPVYSFDNISDYISADRPAHVVKLHGSINWFSDISYERELWQVCVDRLNLLNAPISDDIIVRDGITQVFQGVDGRQLYPILTAPLAGKGLADAVCPSLHIDFVRQFLAMSTKILVIGTSGQDQDLLMLLNESIPEDLSRLVHFVGGNVSQTEDALAKFKEGVAIFRNNPLVSVQYGGFQNYVTGANYKRFVEYQL